MTKATLAITPYHQQNMHVFADGCKNINDIFNDYVPNASHMYPGLHFQMSSASPERSFGFSLQVPIANIKNVQKQINVSTNQMISIPPTRLCSLAAFYVALLILVLEIPFNFQFDMQCAGNDNSNAIFQVNTSFEKILLFLWHTWARSKGLRTLGSEWPD